MVTWIIITLVSLIFSALFSGVEIAYVTSDRVRTELDVKMGGPISRALNVFYRHPEFFISTILVGNNIALVIYGMGFAKFLEEPLVEAGVGEFPVLLIQTLVSTGVILLMGEFFPKTIFRINPNASLKLFALPMMAIYAILYPISLFTTWLSRALMKLFGVSDEQAASGLLSVGDLNQYLERTIDDVEEKKETIENEVKIFHNALDFSTTHLRDCMTPRNEIFAVDIDKVDREELCRLFTSSGRSKLIVYKEDIDNILGYIHVSELFHTDIDWRTRLKEVIYAPETVLANKMMRRLLSEKRSIAIVIDEFGGTSGMVTLEDLVEEIFGDIQDEHDHARLTARRLPDGSYEFSGRIEITTLNDTFHLDIPEDDEYQTLMGYILHSTGAIPEQGEIIILDNLRFEILKKSATRLELIGVTEIITENTEQ
ncbi:MAG: hemolysin [Bacteroidales bacterium 52_46]|nr:MAG: hemolysin [Bacteroidales bacterium 52_46]